MIFCAVPAWFKPPEVPVPDDPPELAEQDEDQRVRSWNVERFEELGLPWIVAYELALKRSDWHAVKRALDGGATVEQVERIFV